MTVAAFAVPTVVCGAWLLPLWLRDAPTCWAVASALGVALAALAALWGHGFATGGGTETTAENPDTGSAMASGNRAIAFNGSVTGTISTGDSAAPRTAPDTPSRSSTPTGSSPGLEPGADRQSAPGPAVASGDRSIAFNGSVEGDVSTGDSLNGGPGQ